MNVLATLKDFTLRCKSYRGFDEVDITTLGVARIFDTTFEIRGYELSASGYGRDVAVSVNDINGVEVLSGRGRGEVALSLSSLAPGVYVARCESGGVIRQKKFVR